MAARLPEKTNRTLIEEALRGAVDVVRAGGALSLEPVIDRDTLGVPGSPDIGQTIFAKIANASAFVCDVSFINPARSGERRTPNPNVLVELGFALKALGWERVVLVFNEHDGRVEDLPFDLRMKRTVTYRVAPDVGEPATARTELTARFAVGLAEILRHGARATAEQSSESRALAALRTNAPDGAALVGDYMSDLARRVEAASPKGTLGSHSDEAEGLATAIAGTMDLGARFAGIAEEVARRNDKEAALRLFHGFEPLLQQYNRVPRITGTFSTVPFELPRFLGHELFTSLVAFLLKHERLGLLAQIFRERLSIETGDGYVRRSFARLSADVRLLRVYFATRGKNMLSPAGAILKDRHSGEHELARLVPWRRFIEADYLLFLRAAFDLAANPSVYWNDGWIPWSYPYLEEFGDPSWLVSAESAQYLVGLCEVFGVPSESVFRERYRIHGQAAGKLFPEGFTMQGPRLDPAKLGSAP